MSVARLPGVPTSSALVWVGHLDTVIVRDPAHLPTKVRRLLLAPTCLPIDAPIRLSGPWLGILGADGHTELDMRPPYDVDLFVRHASTDRYARAFLTVRVPSSLGEPLTEHDVHTSLWKGGSISLMATCRQGRYLASSVSAAPPGG